MISNAFEALVLEVNFLGIQAVEKQNKESRILLYFCREIDSVDAPLSITEDQAKQLYNDLEKLFSENTI
jgi:hypothetical protein